MSNHLDALFGQNQYVYHNKQGSQIDYTFPRLLTKEQSALEDMMNKVITVDDGGDSVQDLADEEEMVPLQSGRFLDVHSKINARNNPTKHSQTKLLSMLDDEDEKMLQKGLTNRSSR